MTLLTTKAILPILIISFLTSCGGGSSNETTTQISDHRLEIKQVRGLVNSDDSFYRILRHPSKNAVIVKRDTVFSSDTEFDAELILEDDGVWIMRQDGGAVAVGEKFSGFTNNPAGQFIYSGNIAIRQSSSTFDGPIQMIVEFENQTIELTGRTNDGGRHSFTINPNRSDLSFDIESGEISGEFYIIRMSEVSYMSGEDSADLIGNFHGDGSKISAVFL